MTFTERVLYHQVHPLKLATDISSAIVAIPLLWSGDLALGLLIGLGLPVVGSALVLATNDQRAVADAPLGAYLRRYMTAPVQAVRLAMGLLILWAAWVHAMAFIIVAVIVVLVAWTYGIAVGRVS